VKGQLATGQGMVIEDWDLVRDVCLVVGISNQVRIGFL